MYADWAHKIIANGGRCFCVLHSVRVISAQAPTYERRLGNDIFNTKVNPNTRSSRLAHG